MEPKSALGAVYSTRLASFYPEGNMPEGISAAGDGLPFFTPSNQIRWSNPSKTLNDNPRIFLKSILKPLKGLEVAFEYTFDKKWMEPLRIRTLTWFMSAGWKLRTHRAQPD